MTLPAIIIIALQLITLLVLAVKKHKKKAWEEHHAGQLDDLRNKIDELLNKEK